MTTPAHGASEIDPRIFNAEYRYTRDDPQFAQLLGHIAAYRRASEEPLVVVGVCAPGGSGKSTLTHSLAAEIGQELGQPDAEPTPIIPVDDFYTGDQHARGPHWPGYNRKALRRVIGGLRALGEASYRTYDWVAQEYLEKRVVRPVGGLVLVEGVGILHPDTRRKIDVPVWGEVPPAIARERGISRMGEESRRDWETIWGPNDDDFKATHKPHEYVKQHPAGFTFNFVTSTPKRVR